MHEPPRFLLVGDSRDLPSISGMLTRLPIDSAGQVYLEVASEIQVRELSAPEGMTVTWLCRDRTPGADGSLAPRGELAARAVSAWVSEWMPDDPDDQPPYIMWIGCSTSAPVTRLYRDLADRLGEAHLHHPHHP